MFVTTVDPGTNSFAGGGGRRQLRPLPRRHHHRGVGWRDRHDAAANESLEANFVIPANVEMVQIDGSRFTGNDAANRHHRQRHRQRLQRRRRQRTAAGARAARDTLSGGAGDDTLRGSFAADRLIGGRVRTPRRRRSGRRLRLHRGQPIRRRAAPDTIVGFRRASGVHAGEWMDLWPSTPTSRRSGTRRSSSAATGSARCGSSTTASNTEVLANIDDDTTPEIRIMIEDGSTQASAYGAQDLVL